MSGGHINGVVVVGTGPSACAVVTALVSRGIKPVVIDSSAAGHQRPSTMALPLAEHLGFKTWNGSDEMYRGHPYSGITYAEGLNVRASNFLGGLSRVWGATYDSYHEYRRWPRQCIPGDPDWQAVAGLVPRSTTAESNGQSQKTNAILPMDPRLESLTKQDTSSWYLRTEASTLAVERRLGLQNACDLQGSCLQGCPTESIWYAGRQFDIWHRENAIRLVRGTLLKSVKELPSHVELQLQDQHGQMESVSTSQVFIATGAIATAAVLISSGIAQTVRIRDSQTAFGGMLRINQRAFKEIQTHALSHVWIRSTEDASFLAQIYPPNVSHAERLAGKIKGLPRSVIDRLARRLFPFIAYLDSDQSGTLLVSRKRDGVHVTQSKPGEMNRMLRQVTHMSAIALRAGFILPPLPMEFAATGGGFHFGASLPHGQETDTWGSPRGLVRSHIVDASVLPHIEAGSITPTVMANAHRIGRTVALAGAQ